jgi:hypothetical protein
MQWHVGTLEYMNSHTIFSCPVGVLSCVCILV